MNTQSLAGKWQFRQAGTDEWLPATVPGGVHTDLLALGRIPDDADCAKAVMFLCTDWACVVSGAALDITLLGSERCRCAVFLGSARIEDFTLRPNETSSVAVPAGEVRVVVYEGGETLDELTRTLERGDSESVVLERGR